MLQRKQINQSNGSNLQARRAPDPNSRQPGSCLWRLFPTRRGAASFPHFEVQVSTGLRSRPSTVRSLSRSVSLSLSLVFNSVYVFLILCDRTVAGRVNLIGEHIDYEGYSVLPMAIRQDTIVAIRRHDEGEAEKVLRIANVNDKYQICTYPADPNQVLNICLFFLHCFFLKFCIFSTHNCLNCAFA